VSRYEARFASECRVAPFGGVREMVDELRGGVGSVRLAIVSSNTARNVLDGLDGGGGGGGGSLADAFEFVLGIDNGPADKAEAMRLALRRMDVQPAEAVYVGDTASDASRAAAAGVRFVGVGYGFEALAAGSVGGRPVAATVEELRALLRRETRG